MKSETDPPAPALRRDPAAVNITFRPTVRSDAAALSRFLTLFLGLDPGVSILDEKHMEWKYWTPRPDWEGSRSFVAQRDGAIIAHAAVWPVRVRVAGQEITAVHAVDWAADRKYPGVGIWILRQLAAKARMMLATIGSDITRAILPVIGFRPHGELCEFARPLRPLREALTTTLRNWKLPVKLLRNTFWRFSHPVYVPDGWAVTPLDPADVPDHLWPQGSATTAVSGRSAASYRYFLDSTSSSPALFVLHRRGELSGYFSIVLGRHDARIVDLWLASMSVEDWCAAFQSATAIAGRETQINEICAWASTALAKEALSRAGFLLCERTPVSVFGDDSILQGRELHLQMLDSDANFRSEEIVDYYLS
jgi:hypothetical protein